jgi:hypothetical protein
MTWAYPSPVQRLKMRGTYRTRSVQEDNRSLKLIGDPES